MEIPQETKIIINRIIREEGGWIYTDDPVDIDKGTFAGVRWETYNSFTVEHYSVYSTPERFKAIVSEKPLPQRLIDRIYEIYYVQYFLKLPMLVPSTRPAIRVFPEKQMLYSCGVNCGITTALTLLQRTINTYLEYPAITIDGVWGPYSGAELWRLLARPDFEEKLSQIFVDEWLYYYFKIIKHNPSQSKFLKGWYNRAVRYR